jgi:hypothetical protein
MKRYLFIDNFRGFVNTYIPILDVNFLVGENSSGKTSVLGLIKLFCNQRFLMGQDFFGDEECGFGNFSDMVSAHSENQTHFRIGFIEELSGTKKSGPITNGMLLTYNEHDGGPRLSQITRTMGSCYTHLRFAEKQSMYLTMDVPRGITADRMASELMPKWIAEHAADNTQFKPLIFPKEFGAALPPLLVALSLSAQAAHKSQKRKTGFSIPGPPWFGPEVVWVAPIRTKPRRTYDELLGAFSSEGSHTPYLIKRILGTKSEATKFRAFMRRVGKASGLFQSIQIKPYGDGAAAPFEVDAVLDEKALNLKFVGYGVSQSLPILVEIIARRRNSLFAIQQPEIHLHPRAQAALGDVFFEMSTRERKRFLIETHSDFAIDRFRLNYRKRKSPKPSSQVLFFERKDRHNTVTPLGISEDGDLPLKQPSSYRNFFIKEQVSLLGL